MPTIQALKHSLLTLLTSLTLLAAPTAQALSITALDETLAIAPGGQATARFEFDFGDTPLQLLAFDLALAFEAGKIATEAGKFSMSFEQTPPDLSSGTLMAFDGIPGVVAFSWAYVEGELPGVNGKGLLSVQLDNIGLNSGFSFIGLALVYSTDLADDLSASAGMMLSAVPEPASGMLILAGLGLLLLRRRPS